MDKVSETRKLKRAARLENVVEVSLIGSASLSYWREQLSKESLEPLVVDGGAQVMLIAAEGRFAGIQFRELSLSVLVQGRAEKEEERGAFLLRAYNSNRFFAFCERTLFSTPYCFAPVFVRIDQGIGFTLEAREEGRIRASIESEVVPEFDQRDGWTGPVYLASAHGNGPGNKVFVASIEGLTCIRPFESSDLFSLESFSQNSPMGRLERSGFSPKEWRIRSNAVHEKSKTYRRSDLA